MDKTEQLWYNLCNMVNAYPESGWDWMTWSDSDKDPQSPSYATPTLVVAGDQAARLAEDTSRGG